MVDWTQIKTKQDTEPKKNEIDWNKVGVVSSTPSSNIKTQTVKKPKKTVLDTIGYGVGKFGNAALSAYEGLADAGAGIIQTGIKAIDPVTTAIFGEEMGSYENNPLYQIASGMTQNDIVGTFNKSLEQNVAPKSYIDQNDLATNLIDATGYVFGIATTGKVLPTGSEKVVTGNKVFDFVRNALTTSSTRNMFLSVAGNSFSRAKNEGANDIDASMYAITNAAVEAGTEAMYGGLGKFFGKGALDDVVKEVIKKKFGQTLTSKLLEFGVGMAAEAGEELISGVLEPFVSYIKDKKLDFTSYNTLGQQALIGGLSSGIMQGGSALVSRINNKTLTEQDYKMLQDQVVQELEKIDLGSGNILEADKEITQEQIDKIKANIESSKFSFTNNQTQADKVEILRQSIQQFYTDAKEIQQYTDTLVKLMNDRNIGIAYRGDMFTDASVNGVHIVDEYGNRFIYLNPMSKKANEFALLHELTHDIKGTKEYQEMLRIVDKYLKGNKDYKEGLAVLTKRYNDFYKQNKISTKNLDVQEEGLADILGTVIGDKNFIATLKKESPSTFNKVRRWIDKWIAVMKSDNKKATKFMYDLQAKFQDAYAKESMVGKGIKYSEQGTIDDKINQSMTMQEAKDMVQRAFVVGDIKNWFDEQYKNGDEWLNGEGTEAVALIIENDEHLISKYINNNPFIINEEFTIADVLDAYQEGTLIGKQKSKTQKLDLTKDTNYKDNRFYSPQEIKGGKELYDLANKRVTNSNRQEVYKARATFIINAHNEGYIESLGLTKEEVNGKLKSWANYTKNALELSKEVNKGVALQNKWTGIENSSIVNTISISNEDMGKLVKDIKGDSSGWQRSYITSTMLALDTHIDYSKLSFEFDVTSKDMTALGDYSAKNDTIRIREAGQNTVAHEIGHYIDRLWGRELLNGYNLGLTYRTINLEKLTPNQKQFVNNFYNFLDDIESTSDIGSKYKMSSHEVFARFVARFVEWTKNTATNNRYGIEEKWYKDNFNKNQYMKFIELLQQKAMLDTTSNPDIKYSVSDVKKLSKQALEKQFQELTGDSILLAQAKLAGIEVRNMQRENGNRTDAIEKNPYSKEAYKIYKDFQNSKNTSNYLYHGTSKENIQSILKSGLTTGNKQNQEGISSKDKIYLAANEELAGLFSKSDNVILRVNPYFKFENLEDDLLGGEGTYSITNNIPANMLQVKENGKWVNLTKSSYTNATDNKGRTLTKEQQEFFKDSKVRDDKGNLLIMYHSSDADFTEFDKKKLGSGYGMNPYVDGFWFSTKKFDKNAKTYSVYLNIKNPIKVGSQEYKVASEKAREQKITVTEYLKQQGYDGAISEGNYIAFEPNQIKSIDNTNPTTNEDIRYSQGGQDAWQKFLDTLPQGKKTDISKYRKIENTVKAIKEQKATIVQDKVVDLEELKGQSRTRGFVQSALDAPNIPKEVKKQLKKQDNNYLVITDEQAMKDATARIKTNGYASAKTTFKTKFENGERMGKLDITEAQLLYNEAFKRGDIETARDILSDLAVLGTEMGQGVQALSLISRLSPEGRLLTLEKAVNRYNKKNQTNVKIKDVDAAKILTSENQEQLDEAVNSAIANIQKELPKTILNRINEWRYLSMLGNPKTHIKNMASNTAMYGTMKVKNKVATLLESILKPEKRTKTFEKVSKDVKEFVAQDAIKSKERIQGTDKYTSKGVLRPEQMKLMAFNSNLLELEDWWFSSIAFKEAMEQYITVNKIELNDAKKVEEARQYAINQAQEATFRQFNKVAGFLSQIEHDSKLGILVGAIMPFKTTPMNIAKAGFEYSPAGLASTINEFVKDVKNGGNGWNSKSIDMLSKNITGSGLMMIGMLLAQMGVLRASGSDDDKEEAFKKSQGYQPYSLQIGNISYTLDWLSPAAMPIFMGAEIIEAQKNGIVGDDKLGNALSNLSTIIDPLTEMSMLQGLNKTMQSYSKDALGSVFITAAQNYIMQFIPTIFGQLARTIEPERKTTMGFGTGATKEWNTFVNQVKAKVPFLISQLQPYVNQFGETEKGREDLQGFINRAFENFLSPGYINEIKNEDYAKLLEQLYNQTGDNTIFPNYSSRYFVRNGEKVYLTPEEYTRFSQIDGTTAKKYLNDLFNRLDYDRLNEEQKVSAVDRIYRIAQQLAKRNYLKGE